MKTDRRRQTGEDRQEVKTDRGRQTIGEDRQKKTDEKEYQAFLASKGEGHPHAGGR